MRKWLILVCVALCLIGCGRKNKPNVQHNVVTEITITCQADGELIQRRYTTPDKMRAVLLYIRSVRASFDAPEEPDASEGYRVQITTVSADKTVKHYYQQGQKYFQIGEERWKIIDPEKGANLWMIIKLLPSDPE